MKDLVFLDKALFRLLMKKYADYQCILHLSANLYTDRVSNVCNTYIVNYHEN